MFSKSRLLLLAFAASPLFRMAEAVVKPRPLSLVTRSLKDTCLAEQQEGACEVTSDITKQDTPFLIEVSNFLTEEECRMYREIPIQETANGKDGKIPVPSHLLQRLVGTVDKVEERPIKRSLKDITSFEDDHEDIVLARRRKLTKTTHLHADKYAEGDLRSQEATGHTTFVFLRTNEEAYFEHGGVRVPVEAGKLLIFASDVPHHTVIQEGAKDPVDILGAFDTEHLYAVGGDVFRISEVWINGEDATSSPGPNVTEGSTATAIVEVSADGSDYENITVEAMLGTFSCPDDNLTSGGKMNCTLDFTAELGAYSDQVNATSDGPDDNEDEETFYYTGVEDEEKCTKFLCRLFCNTFLRFIPFLCRLFGGK